MIGLKTDGKNYLHSFCTSENGVSVILNDLESERFDCFFVDCQWVNIPHISNYHQWFFLSNFGLTENPTFVVSINISRTNYTAVFNNKSFYLCDVWVFTIIIILWVWVGFNNTLEYPYKTRKNCVLPILNLTNQQWTVLKC